MNALATRIAALIETQGPMTVAQFMNLCLHDPEHGAYASRNPIGSAGDFVTAPEVSQTFGEMCGLWLVQCWHNQGRPKEVRICELGPGRGVLMRDALRAIASAARAMLEGADIVLVETSAPLQDMQRRMLEGAPAPIRWIDGFGHVEPDRPLFLIANEFFDCMPIRQLVKQSGAWHEKMVVRDADGGLALGLSPLAPGMDLLLPPKHGEAPEGAVYEFSAAATALASMIAESIAKAGGAGLIIDYGYDTPGFRETLQAVARHQHADVLKAPGSCDLSAHVDFASLKANAAAKGANVFGPRDQGDFLAELGIEVRAQRLMMSNPKEAKAILAGVKRLIDPEDMGGLFKVLALGPASEDNLPGF